ncbi:MAG: YXWGXW repeat-containing protein [Saprospiraceae bacterium]|nr:YXWGXW repeat-containing protein [Saprospiraceae bacterium]
MKKFPLLILALLFAGMLIPNTSDAQVLVRTKQVAPGVTIVKTKPVHPGNNFVWVDGYWDYNPRLKRYTYVEGYWLKRRNPKQVKVVHYHTSSCH